MAIGVLLKQVPDTTAKIGVSEGRVDETAVSKWSMSCLLYTSDAADE